MTEFTTILEQAWKWILGVGSLIALFVAIANWVIGRRAHLLNVYAQVLQTMDTPEMRDARRYVYGLLKEPNARNSFQTEHWLNIDEWQHDANYKKWKTNQERTERVVRSFDQLGLLVREGRVPINLLSRFYATPALKCWYALIPYVDADRRDRKQPGHLWEWEHLVLDVIIPGLERNLGVWKGLSKHDQLEPYIKKTQNELTNIERDLEYAPPLMTWEIGHLCDIRKW